ncbi:uncharacterized protein LOC143146130 [Ptiloglossa arizonensis]|uniref:uncharacterized protein LOC143146130 n=1 Tax=Ptiloglossa arizonensis TaxID=3350558 RepID=UPI003FA0106E
MAPPKRKTRGSFEKERITVPRYSHRQHRKRLELPRRVQTYYQPINVPELVYRLLNADKHNQGGPDRFLFKMRKYKNHRESSYDTPSLRESTDSIEESEYTKSRGTSIESLPRVMDATNSSRASGSENSSVSNISVEPITLTNSIDNTRTLLKKKSLVQIINNYIRAGIQEGKRQAKKYIRKALSFGVKSGYLIPTDPQGQVIRVSPMLVDSSRKSDPELRRKRRRARKGEDDLTYVERKDHRQETPSPSTKKKTLREDTPEVVVPRKRRKTTGSKDTPINLKLTYPNLNKKVTGPGRRKKVPETPKPQKVVCLKYVLYVFDMFKFVKVRSDVEASLGLGCSILEPTIYYKLASNTDKHLGKKRAVKRSRSKSKNRTNNKKQKRKGRPKKSPTGSRKDNNKKGNSKKKQTDLSEDDEDSARSTDNEANQRTGSERRKSSGEGVQRDVNEAPGNPAEEVEENLESQNNDNNDKNMDENTNLSEKREKDDEGNFLIIQGVSVEAGHLNSLFLTTRKVFMAQKYTFLVHVALFNRDTCTFLISYYQLYGSFKCIIINLMETNAIWEPIRVPCC